MTLLPKWLVEKLGWVAVWGAGFLFMFYVNSTYVDAGELEESSTKIEGKLDAVLTAIKADSEQREHDIKIDTIRDKLSATNDEIETLTVYIEEAGESELTSARKRRVRELQLRKEQLETDLQLELK